MLIVTDPTKKKKVYNDYHIYIESQIYYIIFILNQNENKNEKWSALEPVKDNLNNAMGSLIFQFQALFNIKSWIMLMRDYKKIDLCF